MSDSLPAVFVHIVTWNSARYIGKCIDALLHQQGYEHGRNLFIHITDNASSDHTLALARENYGDSIAVRANKANFGFCAAHNSGVGSFLQTDLPYFLVLNPDVRLGPTALERLTAAADQDGQCGFACPKLLRADDQLEPVSPRTIDSAGMMLTANLRHLDRGSQEPETDEYNRPEYVFGGSGACLLLKRACIEYFLIEREMFADRVREVFPELFIADPARCQLFDEAFFAYREDADLAWRAMGTPWRCLYVPDAVGYHKRAVLPEHRRELPAALNMHSVRNRFLLQINNYSFRLQWRSFLGGVVFRNLVVILGVLLFERSSLPAFGQLGKLWRRALYIRRANFARRADSKM